MLNVFSVRVGYSKELEDYIHKQQQQQQQQQQKDTENTKVMIKTSLLGVMRKVDWRENMKY